MSQWNRKYASAWTRSSIDCYKRGCNCRGCYIQDMLETPCLMKDAVIELVKLLGAPKENEMGLTPQEQKVIDAILAGCDEYETIAEKTGKSVASVRQILSDSLYKLPESEGYEYTNKRYKFKEFIEWVRNGN